jgi:hypothetical protein
MGIAYNTSIVRDGLVLHLDAANVKSYPGTGTTWFDLSGNGNHGTLANGVGYSANNNGTMSFDGVDDRVSTPQLLGTSVTLSVWFNTDNIAKSQNGIFTRNSANLIQLNNNSTTTWWPDVRTSPVSFSTPVLQDVWYNICITQSGTTCYAYLNGEEIYFDDSTVEFFPYNGTAGCSIGSYGSSRYFSGFISSPSVYNRALTPEEIKQNFFAYRGRYGI